MHRLPWNWSLALPIAMVLGCSSETSVPPVVNGTGGSMVGASGATSGGAPSAGSGGSATPQGGAATSGATGLGGSSVGGGMAGSNAGGTISTGGTSQGGSTVGGNPAGGSSTVSGGASNGGASNGGAQAGGGGTSAGGKAASGGSSTGGTASGGKGGQASGGATTGGAATGGTSTGGAPSTGGTGGATSSCGNMPTGTCSMPTVRISDITLPNAVVTPGNVNDDLALLPFAISAIPSGGSRLAWMGTDKRVYVGELDCNDKLVGTPFSFPGRDFQDLYADDNGGVLLITRDATGSGTSHCGAGPLCGTPKPDPCFDMYLVRFDTSGKEVWATKVTDTSATLEPYTNGARFIWDPYQHHGRIAFDGKNYASYFCIGITAQKGSCVDIHEGDRMQVVNSSGAPVPNHPDSFSVGCSHSWTTRLVWDPRVSRFVMVCATDGPCGIRRPGSGGGNIAAAACDGHLFGGDVVLASTTGYWTSYSGNGAIHLAHFTTAAADQNLTDIGTSDHSHLVAYGTNKMIVSYGSGNSIAAQVRDAGTGASLGSFTIGVPDHPFQSFKPYPDGSTAFPAKGANNTSAKIARVLPCPG